MQVSNKKRHGFVKNVSSISLAFKISNCLIVIKSHFNCKIKITCRFKRNKKDDENIIIKNSLLTEQKSFKLKMTYYYEKNVDHFFTSVAVFKKLRIGKCSTLYSEPPVYNYYINILFTLCQTSDVGVLLFIFQLLFWVHPHSSE